MSEMKQFMVLITELDLARLDALRIVMGTSRAEVARQALAGRGIKALEREQIARLTRLNAVAGAAGYGSWEAFVINLVKRPEYRQVTPALEELEQTFLGPEAGTAQDLGTPDANSQLDNESDFEDAGVLGGSEVPA